MAALSVIFLLLPVKWKLAKLLVMSGIALFPDPPDCKGFPVEFPEALLPKLIDILSDFVIMSAPLGRVVGIAQWGKMLGFIGVINMCSVQLVSKCGARIRSTSTFKLRCSNGHENVSGGILYMKQEVHIKIRK